MTAIQSAFSQPESGDWQEIITTFSQQAQQWLAQLDEQPVATLNPSLKAAPLPQQGIGNDAAITTVKDQLLPQMSASRGPRYWGFVTGGATPIATYADWLVSLLDQNVSKGGDSIATLVERQAIAWLVELFDLPTTFTGLCTTGATASNLLAAVTARQFAGQQQNIDVAKQGVGGLSLEVFSACPHASMVKTLGLAGLGQDNVTQIKTLPDSEAMDCTDLADKLQQSQARSKIVISSAATVTGTSFDDLSAVSALCRQHKAWLHVDAAFGIFARLLDEKRHQCAAMERADSITLDGHKWLNVPYDCGMFLTRHADLLEASCHVAAPYLVSSDAQPDFMSLGIENSRRFRALPLWMTLQTYGKAGIKAWIDKNCRQAQTLGVFLEASSHWQLVHPCSLNVVLFRPASPEVDCQKVLTLLNSRGKVFFSPGKWQGQNIIRAAFSNWQTEDPDLAIAMQELRSVAECFPEL